MIGKWARRWNRTLTSRSVIVRGLALVLAWFGLDAIDWARRARNAGEDA